MAVAVAVAVVAAAGAVVVVQDFWVKSGKLLLHGTVKQRGWGEIVLKAVLAVVVNHRLRSHHRHDYPHRFLFYPDF